MKNTGNSRPKKSTPGAGMTLLVALVSVVSTYVFIVGAYMMKMHV
ncbi:MAG: hypothetical protein AB1513_04545 [Pseudomonadota bacterium]